MALDVAAVVVYRTFIKTNVYPTNPAFQTIFGSSQFILFYYLINRISCNFVCVILVGSSVLNTIFINILNKV